MKYLIITILLLSNLAIAGQASSSFKVNIILNNSHQNNIPPIPPLSPPIYSLYDNYIFSCSLQLARFDGTATTFCTQNNNPLQAIEIPNAESSTEKTLITPENKTPYWEHKTIW